MSHLERKSQEVATKAASDGPARRYRDWINDPTVIRRIDFFCDERPERRKREAIRIATVRINRVATLAGWLAAMRRRDAPPTQEVIDHAEQTLILWDDLRARIARRRGGDPLTRADVQDTLDNEAGMRWLDASGLFPDWCRVPLSLAELSRS
jgi:hypothetical protein